jgi:hypothetical protein
MGCLLEVLEPRRLCASTVPTGTITGVVFNDLNHNAVRDTGEPGLPGYRIFLDINHDGLCGKKDAWTRASSTGRYTFSNVPIGKYQLCETTVETRGPTSPTSFVVNLKADARAVRSFGNAGGTISGSVFLDIDRDGRREADDVGIPHARVYLDLDNDSVLDSNEPTRETTSSGRFRFGDLLAGQYRIRVLPIEHLSFTTGDARKVILPPAGNVVRHLGVLGG